MIPSTDSQVTQYYSATAYSSQASGEDDTKPDVSTIEEAESSLRDSDSLNYEEARVLLGRYEYQNGNIEAALRVFEGIDIDAATPKMKISLSEIGKPNTRRSQNYAAPPFSINTVSLLLEAAYLKSKSLQNFGRYKVQPLSWDLRLKIAIGAARGLAFLHSSDDNVIYRDLKASNILLDGNYNAKISDFGLAKLGPLAGMSHVTTRVMGTYGYAAPEYIATVHCYSGPPTKRFMFHARATQVSLTIDNEKGEYTQAMCIELVANRFLRKMVRVLVATSIREAAAGAEDDALIKLMDATCRRATAPPAPPPLMVFV